VAEVPGRTFFVAPPYDPAVEADIRRHFAESYTVEYENYAMLSAQPAHPETVACR
jgi:hypothetical protein